MTKVILILLVALTFEAVGVVLLSRGIKELGEVRRISVAEVSRVVREGVANKNVWLGIFFEALFFVGLLVLLAKHDVSFVWPMTSLSFVFTSFAAVLFLQERISPLRWGGVGLIVLGAALISWSEHTRQREQSSKEKTLLTPSTHLPLN